METYRYVNIFETKGLEYLLLASFLVLFVVLVRYLQATGRNPRHPESRLYFDGLLTTNQRGETVFRGETLQTLTNSNELNIR